MLSPGFLLPALWEQVWLCVVVSDLLVHFVSPTLCTVSVTCTSCTVAGVQYLGNTFVGFFETGWLCVVLAGLEPSTKTRVTLNLADSSASAT